MWKYIIPRIALGDVPRMLLAAIGGGIIAGIYGILHDQITYSISPEYFTKLKFNQFRHADFGLGDRVFVATIGFLATWWVGFIAAWFLARRLIPHQPRDCAYRKIRKGIMCIIAFALSFGIFGYGYGLWRGRDADYSSWTWAFREFEITDTWSFVRVAYIHNAGYLGGLIGFVVALVMIRPHRDHRLDLAGEHPHPRRERVSSFKCASVKRGSAAPWRSHGESSHEHPAGPEAL
jgi:hypothetical protein